MSDNMEYGSAEAEAYDAISLGSDGYRPPDSPAGTTAAPDTTEADKALIKEWTEKIKRAKKHYEKRFERMKQCQMIANEGRDKDWPESNYIVPVLKRHINVAVAALYARNPTATAKRKKKVQFQLWDGNYASLQQAMMAAQPKVDPMSGTQMPGDPNATALLMEVQQAHQDNVLMDRAGKTLEILFDHYLSDPGAGYKQQLKACVRRTKVCSVSWVKLGFQRVLEKNPDITGQIDDVTNQIQHLTLLLDDLSNDKFDENSARMAELKSMLADLQAQQDMIVREGPVLGFPKGNAVIVDTHCSHLKTLSGAQWIAEEFPLQTRDDIKETFGVDVGTNFTACKDENAGDDKESYAKVWQVWNKKTGQVFVICEGYDGWLKAPAAPDVKLTRFWPYFPIVFNEVEDDKEIYANSDVWDGRHMQKEYNTVRQGLREHRVQNRPKYAVIAGKLEEKDLKKLAEAQSGDVIELNALTEGVKISDVLQMIQTVPIDPNLYEVTTIFSDIERVIGSSQADLGAPASTTATQSSIIEQGRSTMNSDNVDDLDDVLTDLAQSMSEVMLLNLDVSTVKKIAGPGAVWPSSPPTRQQMSEDLWLEIKAGSSGRPNRAAELANMERGLPYLIQLPGVNPYPLGRRYGELLDLDVDDIVIEGMPAIVAQNAAAGRDPFSAAPAGASTDPQAQAGANQGPAGASNAPNPVSNEPGPQPGYTAPGESMVAPGVLGTQQSPVPAPRYKAEKIPIGPGAAPA